MLRTSRAMQMGVVAVLSTFVILIAIGTGGWPGAISGCIAAGDCACEAIGSGLLAQPSNTGSSLFLVIAGLVVLFLGPITPEVDTDRAMRPVHGYFLGAAILGAGLGSIAFHSSMTEWGGWADLVGAAAILAFASVFRLVPEWSGSGFAAAYLVVLGAAAIVLWLVGTENGKWVLVTLGVVALVLEAVAAYQRDRGFIEWRWLGIAATVFAGGVIVWWFSREGNALCHPTSVWQWHGIWHLAAAIAVVCVYMFWRSELRPNGNR